MAGICGSFCFSLLKLEVNKLIFINDENVIWKRYLKAH